MKSPVPMRVRVGRLLPLAYAPLLAWSLFGAGWTMWNHPFTLTLAFAYLLFALLPFAFKRRPRGATAMIGIAGCHALGAFALHAWLRLPLWSSAMFFLLSFALLIVMGARVMNRAGAPARRR